jgi:hypothetical protein
MVWILNDPQMPICYWLDPQLVVILGGGGTFGRCDLEEVS